MKNLLIAFFICGIRLSVYAQDYLRYDTIASQRTMEDINTLLTYRKWDEMKGEQPDFELSYSKDKKDRKKYDSLSKIASKKYWEWDKYTDERLSALSGLLRAKFFYKGLNNYKEQLIPSVWYDYIQYQGGRSQYTKFLSLLDIPSSKKDSLLQDKETSPAVRARLGDKEAEQEIIRQFNEAFINIESSYFKDRFDLADNLLYINTEASLDAFFEMVGSDRIYYLTLRSNSGWGI